MELLLCAVTILAYVATLSFGFVYDDEITIVGNAAIRTWRSVPSSFLSTVGNVPIYRPLATIWECANYSLFRLNPAWWHVAAVACHVVVTLLVFLLASKLLGDRAAAFIAGIVFAVHPVHVENVAWVSAVSDLLMSMLLLASFICFLDFRQSDRRRWLAVSLILFALSLLAKEPAVVLPVLVLGYLLIYGHSPASISRTRLGAIGWSVPYFCIAGLYLLARVSSLRGPIADKATPLSWKTMLLTVPSVLWFDLRHLVFPLESSEFYPVGYAARFSFGAVVLPLLIVVVIAAAAAICFRRLPDTRPAKFAAFWILLPILPTLYLRGLTRNDFVHDRFLYLPSVGLALLVALAIRHIPWSAIPQRRSAIQLAVLVIIGAVGLGATIKYEQPWASSLRLYQNALKYVPESSNVKDDFANQLLDAGQVDRAISLYREVIARDPDFWRSQYNLGYAYYKLGKYGEAEDWLRRAIATDPTDADQFIRLAVVQMRQGRLADAAANAGRAIQRQPASLGYHYVLAMILEARQDREGALLQLALELKNNPGNGIARAELERLQLHGTK
jgi:thioredoxin-like negative regulator of GroEL